jgi:uncharacterized protein
MDGIRQLEEAGINYGVLVVVNAELVEYGAERFLACLDRYGLTGVGLLNVLPDNRTPTRKPENYLEWSRFVEFLVDVYLVRERQYRHIRIREIESLAKSINNGTPSNCIFAGDCMGQYLTVEPTGEVSACDKYIGDRSYVFGNVATDSIGDILADGSLSAVRKLYFEHLEPLRGCQYFRYCNGGCPHDQYVKRLVDPQMEIWCCGFSPLIEAILRSGKGSVTAL